MTRATEEADADAGPRRPLAVYVTAGIVGALFVLAVGWELLSSDASVRWAIVPGAVTAAYLSRKRLPSEAVGSGFHLTATVAVLAALVPYVSTPVAGTDVGAVATTGLPSSALLLVVYAAAAYVAGRLLKDRTRRKLRYRAVKGVPDSDAE